MTKHSKKPQDLSGDGIKDIIRATINIPKRIIFPGIPPRVRSFLRNFGDQKITGMKLVRKPIEGKIKQIINIASLGQFQANLKSAQYDEIFHLSIDIEFGFDPKKAAKIEKLARISISQEKADTNPYNADILQVNLPAKFDLTINQLIQNTYSRMGKAKFLGYSSHSNNCQDFLVNILQANKLNTDQLENFIKQDTQLLFKKMGYLKPISDKLTDVAAIQDTILQGGNNIVKLSKNKYFRVINKEMKMKQQKDLIQELVKEELAKSVSSGAGVMDKPKKSRVKTAKKDVEFAQPPEVTQKVQKSDKPKRKPTVWTEFCSAYYKEHCKDKGVSYKDMLKSQALKDAYQKSKK